MTALGLTEAVAEDRESAVTFASSISDSEEEEEGLESATPPRPMLRSCCHCCWSEPQCISNFSPFVVHFLALIVAAWSAFQPLLR